MSKVGVLTMNRVINYGSILQTYATQHAIEKLGYECEIIDYRYPNEFHYLHGRKVVPMTLKNKIGKTLGISARWRKIKKFKNFQKKYLNLSKEYASPEDLQEAPPLYDIYMSGSDQVWNPLYRYGDQSFLMGFVPDGRKIVSYASSFSTDDIPAEDREIYTHLLQRFQHISVREEGGAKIVKALTGRTAVVDLDPTLLLTPDEWNKITPTTHIISHPYIFVYILTYAIGDLPHLNELIGMAKKKTNLPVVYLGSLKDSLCVEKVITDCGPSEFISLVRDASYVITSSFHGTAFALNFGKPLLSIVGTQTDDRILSLLKQIGEERQVVEKDKRPTWEDFDAWTSNHNEYKKLSHLRDNSLRDLKSILEK